MLSNHHNGWISDVGGGEINFYIQRNTAIKGIGIESDRRECRFVKEKGLEVYNLFIDIEKEDKKIRRLLEESDIVSFFNVLEHMVNPKGFLDYIGKRMRPGAILALEVPRHPSAASFTNLTCKNQVYRHIDPPIHVQIFSEDSLVWLLEDLFDIQGKWLFGQGYSDLINNAMLLSGEKENELYHRLMDLSNTIQPVFDRNGLADQILLVAKKR